MADALLDVDCDIVGGDWDTDVDWDGLAAQAVAAALAAVTLWRLSRRARRACC